MTANIIKKIYDNIGFPSIKKAAFDYYSMLEKCPAKKIHDDQHIRMAIIFHQENMNKRAKLAIEKALLKYKEKNFARVYYWAGEILGDKKYWKTLIDESPFSFHATFAAQKMNINILERYKDYKPKKPKTILYSYARKMISEKYPKQTYKLIIKNMRSLSPESLYFYGKLFKDNNYLNWASFLATKANHKFKYSLSQETVLLSFFDHHLDSIKERSSDPLTILSLIKQESGFDPKAKSRANAKGLMQIIDPTAKQIDPIKAKDLFNEKNNLEIGVKYFESLKKDLEKEHLALASYNAGPHRVSRWIRHHNYDDPVAFIDLIPFDETRVYVGSILRNKYYYQKKQELKD